MANDYFDLRARDYRSAASGWPWSWLRQREASAVMDLFGELGGCASLDLGCGAGFYAESLLQAGASHVTAVDRSRAMIDQLPSERVTPVVADAATSSSDVRFARIVCAGLMEFVPDPLRILRNAHRLAAHQGVMVVLLPRKRPVIPGRLTCACGRLFGGGRALVPERSWEAHYAGGVGVVALRSQ